LSKTETNTLSKNQLSKNIDAYLEKDFAKFHSPAHCGFLNIRDLSEIEGLDDLQNPRGVLKDYQNLTAAIFGAQSSFFLVNGASIGLQAACLSLKLFLEERNDQRPVLVARNIHKSVLSGIILAGLEISWLEPDWNTELGIYTRVQVQKEIENNYSALIITNPSYEGFYSEIPKLGIPVIVDEAHGAHFKFSDNLPKPALEYGADIAVQSWHKTLGSLTQTGVLHQNKNSKIKREYIEASIKLLQTTSPSYILLESLCKLVEKYKEEGPKITQETINRSQQIKKYRVKNDDPYRCLLQVPGLSGQELDDYLFENRISIEQVHQASALAFINPGNTQADLDRLNQILSKIKSKNIPKKKFSKPLINKNSFKPRMNFFKEQKTQIEAPCPPGIIKNYPGENK
jgi:arginine/lysine/ornithine decarboxylase